MVMSVNVRFVILNFRDNPKLGDGNLIFVYYKPEKTNNFRDNPKLGDGNLTALFVCQVFF